MEHKKEIVLVGTFHFKQEALLTEKENEILELVDFLKEFKPTKIALEWDRTNQQELNDEYKMAFDISPMNEIHQLGFRLAKQLEHKELFAVNFEGRLTQDDMPKLYEAIKNKYPEIEELMITYTQKAPNISPQTNLLTSFRDLNDRENNKELETLYLSFAVVEDDGTNIGVSFLNKWIERELMIFKNVLQIVDNGNERILLIIGSDHLWMLEKLFKGNGWDVINPFGH